MTGEGTFEEGAGLPWHVCENGTGQMAFNINDGVYSILIKNPGGASNGGDDRWDCQFRHRGMTITYGHKYRLTYSVYATNSGKMYAKMGDITNDNAEYWHNNGNKLSMTYEADMTQDELASALKAASGKETTNNQNDWDVKYYEGWDKWKEDTIPAKKWTTYAWEFYIDKESRVTGTPIAGLKLRSNLTICSINRKGRLLLPTGADSLQVGDYVIVVTTNPGMNDITDILQA